MKLLVAVLVLTASVIASAQTTRIVSIDAFDLSYTGGLLLKSDDTKGKDKEETTFKFNLNYAQNIEQYVGLMWKARVFFNRTDIDYGSQDVLESRWGAAGGLLYNFQPNNIKESFFVGGLFGLERGTVEENGTDDISGWNVFVDLEAGKRFDLGQYSAANISYAPSFALTFKRYGGDLRDDYAKSGNEIKLNFLKFDILF